MEEDLGEWSFRRPSDLKILEVVFCNRRSQVTNIRAFSWCPPNRSDISSNYCRYRLISILTLARNCRDGLRNPSWVPPTAGIFGSERFPGIDTGRELYSFSLAGRNH